MQLQLVKLLSAKRKTHLFDKQLEVTSLCPACDWQLQLPAAL